jgi:hypothetical protein
MPLLSSSQRVTYWLALLEQHPRLWSGDAWELTLLPAAFPVKPNVSQQFSRHPLLDGAQNLKPEAVRDQLDAFVVCVEATTEGEWLNQPIYALLASKVKAMSSAQAAHFLDICFYHGVFNPCLEHWTATEPARILLEFDLQHTAMLEANPSPETCQVWFNVAFAHRPARLSWLMGQCRWLMGPTESTRLLQQNLDRLDPATAKALALEQARGSSVAVATREPMSTTLQPLTAAIDTYLWALRPIAAPPTVLEAVRSDTKLDSSQVQASIEDGGSHCGSAVSVGLAQCAISGLPVGSTRARSEVRFAGLESYLSAAL